MSEYTNSTASLPVISVAQLQRTIAVMGVLASAVAIDVMVIAYAPRFLPAWAAQIVFAAPVIAWLFWGPKLLAWERKRRQQDEAAVRRVVEAALSLVCEAPEDRAIFPVFYRGHKPSRLSPPKAGSSARGRWPSRPAVASPLRRSAEARRQPRVLPSSEMAKRL